MFSTIFCFTSTIFFFSESKEIDSNEELVLNTIATVNNLSYYNVKNSAILLKELHLAKCLLRFLNIDNMEGMAEATRVYGNLSRSRPVRDFLAKHKGRYSQLIVD